MHAHSQYCWSGDNTLQAAECAVTQLADEDSDEAILVLLSDANLQRYGISPVRLAQTLSLKPNVSAYAIFIGSLGDQAERYVLENNFQKASLLYLFYVVTNHPEPCQTSISKPNLSK